MTPATAAWLRRPLTLTTLSLGGVGLLLAGGLGIARATGGVPVADSSPAPTATPAATASTDPAAGPNGDDNAAFAVNRTDGRTVYAISLKIVKTDAATVDATNAAVAVASCTDCTTVAISFEGVLVSGSPTTFDPTNLALAYNVDCTGCTTFADAYQQVVQGNGKLRITGEGRRRIAEIRRDLKALQRADLPFDQVVARVQADEAAFADVLRTQVVEKVKDVPSAGPTPTADPTPTGSATPDAAPTATGDPTSTGPSDGATQNPATTPSTTPGTPGSGPAAGATPTATSSPAG